MIIGSAAHFTLCSCGHHGKVVTATGMASLNLVSKEEARQALDQALEKGLVMKDEIGEVLRQINVSTLPEHDEDVSLRSRLEARLYDIIDAWPDRDNDEEDKKPSSTCDWIN